MGGVAATRRTDTAPCGGPGANPNPGATTADATRALATYAARTTPRGAATIISGKSLWCAGPRRPARR